MREGGCAIPGKRHLLQGGVGQGLAVVVCCPSEPFVLVVVCVWGEGRTCRCLMSNQALRWGAGQGGGPEDQGPPRHQAATVLASG